MGDLSSPRVICIKGGLFVLLGVMALGLILLEHPEVRTAILLGICIWSFCRAYYFAFYVLQNYVDPNYRFAGLTSVAIYFLRRAKH
ncbi:hypothetical protein [Schlesneria paludicola]|uniref:hypothetical protein n=1 Tax=Schlesneria paludicola TaxID=360056 RepID=UPI00029AE579|nr:hypothetical protein [Schlesneria paludicola]